MSIKPILFSTPMVQAILDGRKTMTRRVIKGYAANHMETDVDGAVIGVYDQNEGRVRPVTDYAPRLQGDILWVRETHYRSQTHGGWRYMDEVNPGSACAQSWKKVPSIHMPREAARLWLRVTGVRAELLQNISEEDARAEGVERLFDYMTDDEFLKFEANNAAVTNSPIHTKADYGFKNYLWHGDFGCYGMGNKQSDAWDYQYSAYESAKGSFSSLWHMINADRGFGWNTNPWVWVIQFERCDAPIYNITSS